MKNLKPLIIILIILFCPISILLGAGVLLVPVFIIGAICLIPIKANERKAEENASQIMYTNLSQSNSNTTGKKLSAKEDLWVYFFISQQALHNRKSDDELPDLIRSKIKDEYVDIFLQYLENCKQVKKANRGFGLSHAATKIYSTKRDSIYSSADMMYQERQQFYKKFYK